MTLAAESRSTRDAAPGRQRWSPRTISVVVLLLWTTGWFLALRSHGGGSWHFFATGGQVLSDLDDGSRNGLHVYAEHPLLQIGPVALGVAWALGRLTGGHGLVGEEIVGTAAGLLIALLVRRIDSILRVRRGAPQRPLSDPRFVVAFMAFVPVWMYAAISSAHLDDILALTGSVLVIWLVLRDQAVWAGLALAVAVDSKPWALPVAVALLALPSARRRALALGVAALGVVAAWAPFFLADPQTVQAMRYTIANTPLSGLHLLDPGAARTPLWDRPMQTIIGAALGGVAIWRGRLSGVLLLVMASRLALDPGSNRYYTAGLAAGALLWDVSGSRWRWPWWSIAVMTCLHFARWVPALDPLHGPLLVTFALFVTVEVLVRPDSTGRSRLRLPSLRRSRDAGVVATATGALGSEPRV